MPVPGPLSARRPPDCDRESTEEAAVHGCAQVVVRLVGIVCSPVHRRFAPIGTVSRH